MEEITTEVTPMALPATVNGVGVGVVPTIPPTTADNNNNNNNNNVITLRSTLSPYREWQLGIGRYTIGRQDSNHIVLKGPSISKQHAIIEVHYDKKKNNHNNNNHIEVNENGQFQDNIEYNNNNNNNNNNELSATLYDLGSRNSSFVGDKRIKSSGNVGTRADGFIELVNNDLLRFGIDQERFVILIPSASVSVNDNNNNNNNSNTEEVFSPSIQAPTFESNNNNNNNKEEQQYVTLDIPDIIQTSSSPSSMRIGINNNNNNNNSNSRDNSSSNLARTESAPVTSLSGLSNSRIASGNTLQQQQQQQQQQQPQQFPTITLEQRQSRSSSPLLQHLQQQEIMMKPWDKDSPNNRQNDKNNKNENNNSKPFFNLSYPTAEGIRQVNSHEELLKSEADIAYFEEFSKIMHDKMNQDNHNHNNNNASLSFQSPQRQKAFNIKDEIIDFDHLPEPPQMPNVNYDIFNMNNNNNSNGSLQPVDIEPHTLTLKEKEFILKERERVADQIRKMNQALAGTINLNELQDILNDDYLLRTNELSSNMDNDTLIKLNPVLNKVINMMKGHEFMYMMKCWKKWCHNVIDFKEKMKIVMNFLHNQEKRYKMKSWNTWKANIGISHELSLLSKTMKQEHENEIQLMVNIFNQEKSAIKVCKLITNIGTYRISRAFNKWNQIYQQHKSKNDFLTKSFHKFEKIYEKSILKNMGSSFHHWKDMINGQKREEYNIMAKNYSDLKLKHNNLTEECTELRRKIVNYEKENRFRRLENNPMLKFDDSDLSKALLLQQRTITGLRQLLLRSDADLNHEIELFTNSLKVVRNNDSNNNNYSNNQIEDERYNTNNKERNNNNSNEKEKMLHVKEYILAKTRELSRAKRETAEWQRRAEQTNHRWNTVLEEKKILLRYIEDERLSSLRQMQQLADMVKERDHRILIFSQRLAQLSSDEKESLRAPEYPHPNSKTSGKVMKAEIEKSLTNARKKKLAAQHLVSFVKKLQSEDRSQNQKLSKEVHALRRQLLDTELKNMRDKDHSGDNNDLHILRARIRELEDEITDLEFQSRIKVVIESQELIDSLQLEVAANEAHIRYLEREHISLLKKSVHLDLRDIDYQDISISSNNHSKLEESRTSNQIQTYKARKKEVLARLRNEYDTQVPH